MNNRADSAQLISLLGALCSFIAANYDRIAAFACALICGGYTLWKWRRAVKRAAREDALGIPVRDTD